jgi:PAS domain S-box-containing protein
MQSPSSFIERARPLISDLAVVSRLYEVGIQCARAGDDFNGCMEAILDAAIFITAADKGNLQLVDAQSGNLTIVAQRGFGRLFLEFFACVHDESAAACGAALREAHRVVVHDVTTSELFAGQASVAVLLGEGVRAVQSTPLISSTGRVFGMISTHFERPGGLTDHRLRYLDLLARQAADYLERKEAERLLMAKELQLEHIAGQAGILMSQCSRDERYLFVNKLCAEFLGEPAEAIVGRKISDVIGEPALEVIRPYIERVLAGERVEYEAEIPYAEAGSRYMQVTYVPDVDAQGIVTGWIATMSDITEQKRLAERVRIADRHKDEFLAVLAHELRNPLAAVSVGVEVLRRGTGASEAMLATLGMLDRQLRHLVRLVDDLLDVSRVNLENIELRKERAALGDLVRQAVDNHESNVRNKRHDLSLSLPERPIYVLGDPVRLVQAVGNLIHNACKYMDEVAASRSLWCVMGTKHA